MPWREARADVIIPTNILLLQGVPDNPELDQRALLELFDIIKDHQLEWDVTIKVSMLEVYNEKVRDLLADDLIMTELDHDLAGAVDLPLTS